ncbi:unnamed protein product [Choristocarpus tenellus]
MGNNISLKSQARSERALNFTPTKQAKVRKINSSNRTLTINQLSAKVVEADLAVGSLKLHRWLKVMGTTRVQRHITPSLLFSHQKIRVDFILYQISRNRKTYRTGLNTIHINEAWFYLIREQEMVHMFPGEDKVGSTKVQHKSHIPKVMFISTVSCKILPMISTARLGSGRFE